MEFENLTAFPALTYDIVDPQGEEHHVVVTRGTYELRAAPYVVTAQKVTHVASLMNEQPDLVLSDVYYGEMNRSSVRYESDLAQHKPKCDVIVIGSAHSPTGKPTPRIDVGIQIERQTALPNIAEAGMLLDHRLAVFGPRVFVRGATGEAVVASSPSTKDWRLTEPEPFTSLPLRYEHAFGGELKIYDGDSARGRLHNEHRLSDQVRRLHPEGDAAPIAHTACLYNPLGVGYLESWYAYAASVERWPAPRIEFPNSLITAEIFDRMVKDEVRVGELAELLPQGMGIVAKAWQPRLRLAGTLDERWTEERWPIMPNDFNMAYWNGAHPDMQCEHLFGDERVELCNMLPGTAQDISLPENAQTICSFRIPKVALVTRFVLEGQEICAASPIDTLIIDLENMWLSIVWRMVTPSSLALEGATLIELNYFGNTA